MTHLATLSFQPEAHDTAANAFQRVVGLTVTVVPEPDALNRFAQFDAELTGIAIGEDGQYKARLAPWNDEKDEPDRENEVELDLYDDILRLEVI